jgi:hypothetical protein
MEQHTDLESENGFSEKISPPSRIAGNRCDDITYAPDSAGYTGAGGALTCGDEVATFSVDSSLVS